MRRTSIERANFRLIESELCGYHDTLNEVEALKADIILSSPAHESEIRSTDTSDTTQQKALKIVSSPEIVELSRRVKAIQFALQMLKNAPEPRKYELLEKKYFERNLTDQGIMKALNIEQATFYRWRRETIQLIANKLGWKV